MTDRDRLIELVDKAKEEYANDITDHTETDYIVECLFNNGVIVPPCKEGDTLYPIIDMSHTACKSFVSDFPIKVLPYQIYYINVMGGISAIPFDRFGKTVFLTKEEAEEKLKELKNGI